MKAEQCVEVFVTGESCDHLSVCVFIVLVCPGVIILLYEAEVFLSLPLQNLLSALLVGRQVTLTGRQHQTGEEGVRDRLAAPDKRERSVGCSVRSFQLGGNFTDLLKAEGHLQRGAST